MILMTSFFSKVQLEMSWLFALGFFSRCIEVPIMVLSACSCIVVGINRFFAEIITFPRLDCLSETLQAVIDDQNIDSTPLQRIFIIHFVVSMSSVSNTCFWSAWSKRIARNRCSFVSINLICLWLFKISENQISTGLQIEFSRVPNCT